MEGGEGMTTIDLDESKEWEAACYEAGEELWPVAIEGPHARRIAIVFEDSGQEYEHGRLMAAAPKLESALQDCMKLMDRWMHASWWIMDDPDGIEAVRTAAHYALAKARAS